MLVMKKGLIVLVFLVLSLAILVSINFVSAVIVAPSDNLVAQFNFSNTDTTADGTYTPSALADGHRAKLWRGANITPDSVGFKSLSLDGVDDFVDAYNYPQYSLPQQGQGISLSVWIKPFEPLPGTTHRVIVVKPKTLSNFEYYLEINAQGHLRFCIKNGTQCVVSPEVVDGRFIHVAATYNSQTKTIKLYSDGIKKAEKIDSTIAYETNDGKLNFGAMALYSPGNDDIATSPYKGRMKDFRLYTDVLTDAEVRGLAGVQATPTCTINNVLITKTINEYVLVNFSHTGAPSKFSVVVYKDLPASGTSPVKSIELCRLAQGALNGIENESIASNPQTYLCAWNRTSAINLNEPLISGNYIAKVYLANVNGNWVSPGVEQCRKAIVNLIVSQPIDYRDIMAYYKFDDSLVNNVTGISTGRGGGLTDSYIAGKYGKALQLNGSVYADVGTRSGTLNISSLGITVSSWINSVSAPGTHQTIASKAAGATTNQYEYLLGLNGQGNVRFCVYDAANQNCAVSNVVVPANQWVSVIGTYDSVTKEIKIYVNGVQKGRATSPGGYALKNGIFMIGETKDTKTFFRGGIDELRVYNKSLTDVEVRLLAGITSGGTCTDSDGGLNYYVKGTILGASNLQSGSWSDVCHSNTLYEGSCRTDGSNEYNQDIYECPNGCSDGACVSRGDCDYNNKKVKTGIRFKEINRALYCDYNGSVGDQKLINVVCQNDFECVTNFCSGGVCTTIREQLESQGSLLRRIWCALSHPMDFFGRAKTSPPQNTTNNGYWGCANVTITGG